MTYERLPSYDLLSKAAEIKKKKDQERVSVEEARTRIPELQTKITSLLGLEEEKPIELNPFSKAELSRRLMEKSRNLHDSFYLPRERLDEINTRLLKRFSQTVQTVVAFEIPVDGEMIVVELSKGKRSMDSSYIDRSLEVDVEMLDSILRIHKGGGGAVVESKLHKQKPFDMYLPKPIGPGGNSDLGPKWSRQMNMDDFNDYNQLLDRLTEPDVVRVDNQVSSR